MNIKCLFGHKWSKWKYIKPIGQYEDKLERVCERCGKKQIHIGLTERSITDGSLSPKGDTF